VLPHYLEKRGNAKIAFFTCRISALPEFNQSVLDFFNIFYSRLIHAAIYDSLNLIVNAFSWGLFGVGAQFRRKEVESAAAVGLCCLHNAPVH